MRRAWFVALALAAAAGACGDASGPGQPFLLRANDVSAGGAHSCAVMSGDRRAVCWGYGASGALGTGEARTEWRAEFVATDARFRSISAGGAHTCGLTMDGEALCWGANDRGQLGNGGVAVSLVPVPIAGQLVFAAISAGRYHTCGVTTDDAAYCWGRNIEGQLGDGSTVDRAVPAPVAGELRFESISAGDRHTCGIVAGGAAYCWGANESAQLGEGHRVESSLEPWPVNKGLSFRQVAAGASHTCGITTADQAFCWGGNQHGALGSGWIGTGPGVGSTEPVPVHGTWRYFSVVTGDGYTCAVEESRQGHCWGRGAYGQLGSNAFPEMLVDVGTPRLVHLRLNFTQLSAGGTHTCGRSPANDAFCWGTGEDGQLGSGELWSDIPLPVLAPAP